MTTSSTGVNQKKNLFSTILLTGLLVGILDITAAMIKFYIDTGKGPAPIFKYIASGVFGNEAFAGGTLMVASGVIFHFIIALIFTTILFILYPTLSRWLKNKFLIGILYGIVIWLVMNRLVLPLSGTPTPKSFDIKQAVIGALILIFMIGIPASIIAHKYYSKK
jgi:ribose/xylose/arabinose/galactoside ABC-type transport system permease subunit